MKESVFKAYDIRGIYPEEINELDAYKIAAAYCDFIKPKKIAIGYDVRLSSPGLQKAAIKAVTDKGVKVVDIGCISTDMLYFTVARYGYDGGFSITASHNPREYNGIKMVREGATPISGDTGINEIRDLAMKMNVTGADLEKEVSSDLIERKDIWGDYIEKIKSFADFSKFRSFKIAANPNFGLAGKVLDRLLTGTDIDVIKLNYEPDGNFPKGRPDPLLPENRGEFIELIKNLDVDFGVAWDADADRCFFFTEKGEFIEGYFITALLAEIFLKRFSGGKIVHDPRLIWAVQDVVRKYGGVAIINKAGHAFIKERMKKENAVFGGEMSAHYFFRDFYHCDNGMIPLVMMFEYLSKSERKLSEIMQEKFWNKYFVSGEINIILSDLQNDMIEKKTISANPGTFKNTTKNAKVSPNERIISAIRAAYEGHENIEVTYIDGISVEYNDSESPSNSWRFNIRGSNTEPKLRFNAEAKSPEVMQLITAKVLNMITEVAEQMGKSVEVEGVANLDLDFKKTT